MVIWDKMVKFMHKKLLFLFMFFTFANIQFNLHCVDTETPTTQEIRDSKKSELKALRLISAFTGFFALILCLKKPTEIYITEYVKKRHSPRQYSM